jgi:hypothetical protein
MATLVSAESSALASEMRRSAGASGVDTFVEIFKSPPPRAF